MFQWLTISSSLAPIAAAFCSRPPSLPQIFIHLLPPYLGMLRPKVETPLSLETPVRREASIKSVSRSADEYFIRKPSNLFLFPNPNRCVCVFVCVCVCVCVRVRVRACICVYLFVQKHPTDLEKSRYRFLLFK